MGYLSLWHKYKDRSTLFLFALGNERTRVASKSLRSASQRFTRDPCPFISQCKKKNVLQSLNENKRWTSMAYVLKTSYNSCIVYFCSVFKKRLKRVSVELMSIYHFLFVCKIMASKTKWHIKPKYARYANGFASANVFSEDSCR